MGTKVLCQATYCSHRLAALSAAVVPDDHSESRFSLTASLRNSNGTSSMAVALCFALVCARVRSACFVRMSALAPSPPFPPRAAFLFGLVRRRERGRGRVGVSHKVARLISVTEEVVGDVVIELDMLAVSHDCVRVKGFFLAFYLALASESQCRSATQSMGEELTEASYDYMLSDKVDYGVRSEIERLMEHAEVFEESARDDFDCFETLCFKWRRQFRLQSA